MSEHATSQRDRTPAAMAYKRYLQARTAQRTCLCGRRAARYSFSTEQATVRCEHCAGGDRRTIADADRNRRFQFLKLGGSAPAAPSPSPRRSVTRPHTDRERNALLERLRQEAV